ncbi:50S ribosomal protein L1 [Candidatus Daviesbacteria bacterium]|nr:50S ribosomal protein L1 [Candidatus Daviesbacteria bacterium]MBI4038048.1 50S ribosomal protein L1 [Candidatus Daviesbacteria bacterium]
MGRPRIKIIDDAQEEAKAKASKKKAEKPEVKAQPSTPDVIATPDLIRGKQSSTEEKDRHVESKSDSPRDDKEKKPQKPGKAKPRSKKYQELTKDLDRTKVYPLSEAVDLLKKLSYSKFEGSLEAHVNTAQTGIRGLVSLPFLSGKKLRILAFGKGADTSGADTVGSDEAIEEINKGKVNFDLVVTTPEWMPKLAKVARILGPRGLMPNPKNNTIISGEDGLKKAVEGFQAGKTEYKTESKAPVIHLALGKLNQPNEELIANIKTLYQTIGKSRVKKITLSPTMGPSVKINLASL